MITILSIAITATYLLLDKYLPLFRAWRRDSVPSRFRTFP